MDYSENTVILRGELQELPQFSHENHQKRFYRFLLAVRRLSGAVDLLPIIAEEKILNGVDLSGGQMLRVEGQIRSHNQRESGVRRLLVFVFASSITAEDGEPINSVSLCGPLCRTPIYRRTPLGREICDVMLAIPRPFHRADYLPCILWGRTANQIALCRTGDYICLQGRMQSRIYTKLTDTGSEERTTYEISALSAQINSDYLEL